MQFSNKSAKWTHAQSTTPTAGWHAPRLPQIDARDARLARLCSGPIGSRVAQWLGRDAVTLSPCGVATEHRFANASVLRLSHPAGAAAVVFDLAAFPELAMLERQPGNDAEPRDAAGAMLRRTVLRALVAPLLDRLSYIGLGEFDALELVRAEGAAPAPSALALRVTWRARGHLREARLWLPEALLDAMLLSLEATAAAAAELQLPGNLPTLRIPGRILLGARTFSAAALQALEPGDVILNVSSARLLRPGGQDLELAPFSCHAAWGTVDLMGVTALVRIDGHQLTLMESPMMTEDTALQESQTLPGHPLGTLTVDSALSSLDIPISFEIDTVALQLGELSSLAPGYVLELAQRVEQVPLRLVAYGRTVGSGELVAVGERLGVRILSIAHHRAHDGHASHAEAGHAAAVR
ncbi:MAG: type III secretion system cytoplasmic ring protein SctQ [Burkholderiaceae bacterium]